MTEPIPLARRVTLPFLVLYGLGTMVGGGFYALLGKVAGEAGMFAPLALALAGLLALLTGFSFAELSARFPVSAGEARYVREGFGRKELSTLVGWLVIATGVVSAAALSVATIGFLNELVSVPAVPALVLLVLVLGGIAGWGIGASVGVVACITVVEVGALVYAAFVASGSAQLPDGGLATLLPSFDPTVWMGIFSAAFLAFYAFVGFEDMVNIAEEVTEVRRTLPVAILISVGLTVLFYVLVATVAVLSVPLDRLAASDSPIAEMVHGAGPWSKTGLQVVSLLTGINGALVQVVMASRVAYGLANKGQAPAWMGRVHPRTRTPLRSTATMSSVVLVLALFFPLTALAKGTSTIILAVFMLVNLSLWKVKRRDPDRAGEGLRVPLWLPLLGAVACGSTLAVHSWMLLG